MIRIGIIGAANSHCGHIARLCNLEKRVDARVVTVWGETTQLADKAAAAGQIRDVVADWRDMAGKIDGVMIDQRHAKHHTEPARFFLNHGTPTFVDKPFTSTLRDARALCALARKRGSPLTSFSVLAQEESFRDFCGKCAELGKIASLSTSGPGDLQDANGGVFFYGVHQVEAVIEVLGVDVERVHAVRHDRSVVAVLHYRHGPMATIHLIHSDNETFHWTAVGDRQVLSRDHVRDPVMYLGGLQMFLEMFTTRREPLSHQRLLAPVAILEAIEGSLRLKKAVRVPKL